MKNETYSKFISTIRIDLCRSGKSFRHFCRWNFMLSIRRICRKFNTNKKTGSQLREPLVVLYSFMKSVFGFFLKSSSQRLSFLACHFLWQFPQSSTHLLSCVLKLCLMQNTWWSCKLWMLPHMSQWGLSSRSLALTSLEPPLRFLVRALFLFLGFTLRVLHFRYFFIILPPK